MLTEREKAATVSTPIMVAVPSIAEAAQAVLLLRPLASITEAAVKPSGILCRKTARKIIHPSQVETKKPEAIAIPSKNVWMISASITEYPLWEETNSSAWVSSPKWK